MLNKKLLIIGTIVFFFVIINVNAVTIKLQDNETEIIVDQGILNGTYEAMIIKFNISIIPSSAVITNATFYMYRYADQNSVGSNTSVWRFANQTWDDDGGANATNLNNQLNDRYNLTVKETLVSAPYWFSANVLNHSLAEYSINNNYVSFWIESELYPFTGVGGVYDTEQISLYIGTLSETANEAVSRSKEYSDVSQRPYLNITYNTPNNPPTFTNFVNNNGSVKFNTTAKWNITLLDTDGLDVYKFAHNMSGTMTNVSTVDISGLEVNTSFNLTVTVNKDGIICGVFWFNDTDNNINSTIESCLTVENTAPTINESINNFNITHIQNLSVTFNCSDVDIVDSVTYFDNTSLFNINKSTGEIFDNPNISEEGVYNISLWCGDGTTNTTTSFIYEITNKAPNVTSVSIIPSPAQTTDNLTCVNTTSDFENDTLTFEIKWYINNINNITYENKTILNSSATSLADDIFCSVRSFDSLEYSDWKNSSILSIGDTTSPVLLSDSLSSTSGVNNANFVIYVNVSEANSVASVLVTVCSPLNSCLNFSMSPINSTKRYSYTYSPSLDGIYQITHFYATDGSNNKGNLSSSLIYTESTTVVSGGGGGGQTLIIFTGYGNFTWRPLIDSFYLYPSGSIPNNWENLLSLPRTDLTSCTVPSPFYCIDNEDGTAVIGREFTETGFILKSFNATGVMVFGADSVRFPINVRAINYDYMILGFLRLLYFVMGIVIVGLFYSFKGGKK